MTKKFTLSQPNQSSTSFAKWTTHRIFYMQYFEGHVQHRYLWRFANMNKLGNLVYFTPPVECH